MGKAGPGLAEGEAVTRCFRANLLIDIAAAGLSKFCADGLMWSVGLKGRESIGGTLWLTNYRLIFRSHPVNRLVGEIGIPLDLVDKAEDRSRLVFRKVRVSTGERAFEFVVWQPSTLIAALDTARAALDRAAWHAMLDNETDLLRGDAMAISPLFERINRTLNAFNRARGVVGVLGNPLEILKDRLIDDAIARKIKDPVNRFMNRD